MSRKPPKPDAAPLTTAQSLGSLVKSARDIMRKDKGLNGDLDRLPLLTWIMFLKFLDDLENQRQEEAKLAGRKFKPAIEAPYRWRDWAANPQGITGSELLAFINNEECTRPDGKRGPGLFAHLRKLTSGNGDDRRDVIATVFKGVDNRMKSGYLLRDVVNKIAGIHFTSSDELHTLGALYESMLREMRDAAGDSGEFYTPRPVVRFMVEVVNPSLGETVLDPACGTGGFLVEAYSHLAKQVKTVADRSQLQSGSLLGCEAKALPYLLAQMNLLLHGLNAPQIDPGNALRFKLTEIGESDRVDVVLTNPPFGGEEEKGVQGNFPDDKQASETALLFLQLIQRRLRRRSGPHGPARAAVIVPNTTLFYAGVASRLRRDLVHNFNLWAVVRLPKGVFEPYTDIETNILFFDTGTKSERILYYRLEPPDGRKQYTKTRPLRFEELAECIALLRRRTDASPHAWFADIKAIEGDPKCILDLHNPKAVTTTAEDPSLVLSKLHASVRQVGDSLDALRPVVNSLCADTAMRDGWKQVRLGRVLRRRKDACEIENGVTYKRLRIQVKGRGVVLRDECDGASIGTKRQFVVRQGQFVLSKIDARNGAFGVVPEEADGAVITGNFWAYDVDHSEIVPSLLQYLTRSDAFISFCAVSSPGATNRRYLQEDLFLEQVARVPDSLVAQNSLCHLLAEIEAVTAMAQRDLFKLSRHAPVALQSALFRLFGGNARGLEDDESRSVVDATEDE
jgi:type I restriction enzyme M protein